MRAAAFTLFGKLSRFGGGPSKAPFLEQVHTNLISVLLHLNEEDDVIKVIGVASSLLVYWSLKMLGRVACGSHRTSSNILFCILHNYVCYCSQ